MMGTCHNLVYFFTSYLQHNISLVYDVAVLFLEGHITPTVTYLVNWRNIYVFQAQERCGLFMLGVEI